MIEILKSPADHIFLVALDQDREWFHWFIGSWIIRDGESAALIDPGPASTIPVLTRALAELGISRLQYILLTHIHVDHAGGTGHLLRKFPDAKVICHREGIPHMARPEKLWKASQRLLGDIADLYGRPEPISEANLIIPEKVELGEFCIECIPTTGHAPHHLAFRMGPAIFSGDAAGETYPLREGIYIRIAAGPGFTFEGYERSLKSLESFKPSLLCFGHFGWTQRPAEYFEIHSAQARLWKSTVQKHMNEKEFSEELVFQELLASDPGLKYFVNLPVNTRAREKHFMFTSIRGMKDYLTQ